MCHFTALLVVCVFQSFNVMLLASLASSFTAAAGIVFALQVSPITAYIGALVTFIVTCIGRPKVLPIHLITYCMPAIG